MSVPHHAHRLVGLLLVLFLAVAAGFAPVPALAREPGERVEVSVTSIAPAVLTPEATLTVTVRVSNDTDATVTGAQAVLASNTRTTTTRSELDSWTRAEATDPVGRRVASQEVPPLDPGASVEIAFTTTPEDLHLSDVSDWGPRGLAVLVETADGPLAAARTFTLWAPPTTETTPLGLTILAAVTGPPVDPDPTAYAATLKAQTDTGGRLDRILSATAAHPEVGWVIDPALVLATRADPQTTGWANRLLSKQEDRDVAALPAYDIDLAAFAHDPTVHVPAEPALASDDPTAEWRRDIAWPGDATPDTATAGVAATRGATNVVVGAGMGVPEEVNYTPTALGTIETFAGPVTGLVADELLGSLLRDAGDDPTTTQRFLAETAVIAQERPGQSREVLAVLDRTWDPDVKGFGALLAAMDSAPWIAFSGLDSLLAAEVPDVERADLPQSAPSGSEMSGPALAALQSARESVAWFATVVPDPGAIMAKLEPGLLAPTSIAYRSDPTARAVAATAGVTDATRTVEQSIVIARRKTVVVGGENVDFPVLVRNELDQPATIQVVLTADSDWLRQTEITLIEVPAHGEASLMVPVRATASGTVLVEVHAQGVGGWDVASPIKTRVILRPELDTVGTWVVVALVVVLLVAGIIRTVRRGQSPTRTVGAALAPPPSPAERSP